MTEPTGDNPARSQHQPGPLAPAPLVASSGNLGWPGPDQFGTIGRWYFLNQPAWIERHVETLELLGGRSAFRRLTIDLVLPSEPESWIPDEDGLASYCIPVARLAKDEPASFIDLRDEQGTTLPLLTRRANATISERALRLAVGQLVGEEEIDPVLDEALKTVVEDEGLPAEIAAGIYRRAAEATDGLSSGPEAERLGQVVSQLQANSFLWIGLRGRPSSRRVLKLCYRISLTAPIVPARRIEKETIEELDLPIEYEGPIDFLGTSRQLFARFTAAVGWDAIDLRIDDPMMQDPQSYHFQVQAPAGLEVSEIMPARMPTGDFLSFYSANQHLYMSAADPGQLIPLTLRLRVQRRGLLNLSMLTTFVITALLWFVSIRCGRIDGQAEQSGAQITAAVLLVVPALLVLFSTRPAENALASSMLTGVRSSVLLCGLSAMASAAAIGGVRPFDSLKTSLLVAAGISTVAMLTVSVAWLGSSRLVRENVLSMRQLWWGDRRHGSLFLAVIAIGPALASGLAIALFLDTFGLSDVRAHGLTAAATVMGIAGALFVARSRLRFARKATAEDPSDPAPTPWAHHGTFATCSLSMALCVTSLLLDSRPLAGAAALVSALCLTLLTAAATANLLEPLRPPDEEEWVDEWDAIDEWVTKVSDKDIGHSE